MCFELNPENSGSYSNPQWCRIHRARPPVPRPESNPNKPPAVLMSAAAPARGMFNCFLTPPQSTWIFKHQNRLQPKVPKANNQSRNLKLAAILTNGAIASRFKSLGGVRAGRSDRRRPLDSKPSLLPCAVLDTRHAVQTS